MLFRSVDVVIMDGGHAEPDHPEFALNPDGTGGSRINQIDWNPYMGLTGTYSYSNVQNHPTHTTGTVAGNTQGWAKKANIYNIDMDLYDSQLWLSPTGVKNFHLSKPINVAKNNKNPTIVNASFVNQLPTGIPFSNIKTVSYRGTTYNAPAGGFSASALLTFGILTYNSSASNPLTIVPHGVRHSADDASITDMINSGVIIVAAAGNSVYKIDVPGGQDYDNYYIYNTGSQDLLEYYNRGSAPGSTPNSICVGSMAPYSVERKSLFSCSGPRIDIYAPGEGIQSSVAFYDDPDWPLPVINDARNSNFYLGKCQGTSMACPQVCGMMASYLESNRTLTASQIKTVIIINGKSVINEDSGLYQTNIYNGFFPYFSLQGGTNKLAYLPNARYT